MPLRSYKATIATRWSQWCIQLTRCQTTNSISTLTTSSRNKTIHRRHSIKTRKIYKRRGASMDDLCSQSTTVVASALGIATHRLQEWCMLLLASSITLRIQLSLISSQWGGESRKLVGKKRILTEITLRPLVQRRRKKCKREQEIPKPVLRLIWGQKWSLHPSHQTNGRLSHNCALKDESQIV